MIELQSKKLDCTTNLQQIYDHLPNPLQAKWRRSAKQYRERTGGGEPTIKELSEFITAELPTENDPVYGRPSNVAIRANTSRNFKKPLPTSGQSAETHIPTLSTEIKTKEANTAQEDKALSTKGEHVGRVERGEEERCRVCKGRHGVSECSAFAKKGLNWRRRFARSSALCYRCLSSCHMIKRCPKTKGCDVKSCTQPSTHHFLLHLPTATSGAQKGEESLNRSTTPSEDLPVSVTMEDSKQSFVLLKVVPLSIVGENGTMVTLYGLLDSVAVSSLITSDPAERLQLHGTPEKVSINTVIHKNHDCELTRVKFLKRSLRRDGPLYSIPHALAIQDLNVSDRYCPNQVDLTQWLHLAHLELPNMPVGVPKVSVLIGQDVPQAHIVLDYCWGDGVWLGEPAIRNENSIWMLCSSAHKQGGR